MKSFLYDRMSSGGVWKLTRHQEQTKEYELMKRGRSSEKEEQVEKNLAFFRHVDKRTFVKYIHTGTHIERKSA